MARSTFSGPVRSAEGFEVGIGAVITPVITTAGALRAGGAVSTPLLQHVQYAPTLTPTSVGAATAAEQTFTVTGLTTADRVFVNAPALTAGIGIVNFRVSAANTLAITFSNSTAGALVPTSGVYQVVALRF